jgi:hypothetical protein
MPLIVSTSLLETGDSDGVSRKSTARSMQNSKIEIAQQGQEVLRKFNENGKRATCHR